MLTAIFLTLVCWSEYCDLQGQAKNPMTDDTFQWGMDNEFLELTPDSILISQRYKLLELNMDGSFRQEIIFENELEIANYTYLNKRDLIAIVLGKKEIGTDGRPQVSYQVRFYDRADQSYFPGYDLSLPKPENVYFRQFLSTTNGQIFVNRWQRDQSEEDLPLLIEVKLLPYRDGYAITPSASPFHLQRRQYEPWPENFKQRWVVEDDGQLWVLNQTQPVLKRYSGQAHKRVIPTAQREDPVTLPNWVQPYLPAKNQKSTRWRFSFSRNIGLYGLGEDLLIGYMTPNREHPDYARGEELGREGVSRFVLNLQRVKRESGDPIGAPISMAGGFLAGVQSGQAVVLRDLGDRRYDVCTVPLP